MLPEREVDTYTESTRAPRRAHHRSLAAAALLLLAYGALSLMMDPRGYLGTDTGGKVATLERMVEGGDLDPDIGYWAEEWDPEGELHPLYYTSHVGSRWVNVTTFPMLVAAAPLYDHFGYRGILILPMLGSLAAAFAARAIAARLRPGAGWPAFWLAGLASPLVLYALDFWEHSIGVALMAWGVVFLWDAVRVEPSPWRGLAAGALFGAAATMRTETFVYCLVAVGVACLMLVLGRNRSVHRPLVLGVASVAGFVPAFGAGLLLEIALLDEPFRSGRATNAAGRVGNDLALRFREAEMTLTGIVPDDRLRPLVLGLVVGACLIAIVLRSRRDRRPPASRAGTIALVAIVTAVLVVRAVDNLGFVPGLLATTPLAAVGLALGLRDERARYPTTVALGALPLVWATQYQGGAGPQWGGRYILVSGLLLAAVGVGLLPAIERWVGHVLVALSIGVSAFGLVWMSHRTHVIADSAREFLARDEPVLVTTIAHQPREYGRFYDQQRWLSAPFEDTWPRAARIVTAAGLDEFGFVAYRTPDFEPPEFEGFEVARSEDARLASLPLVVVTYRALDEVASQE